MSTGSFYIIRAQITSRGGGIEIDLSPRFDGKMTAYQNYLGGGLMGRVCNSCNIPNWRDNDELVGIAKDLAKYFYELTNPDDDLVSMSFEENQRMPVSSY